MNLDDLQRFAELDTLNMRVLIDGLPDQLEAGWDQAAALPIPPSFQGVDQVVIAAQGTLAIAGDLIGALYADACTVSLLVHRGHVPPSNGSSDRTLLILPANATEQSSSLSHSGPTFRIGNQPGATWTFKHEGPDRTALAIYLGMLLNLFSRKGWIADAEGSIRDAAQSMRDRIPILGIDGPVVKNPAKRLGGQMIGRIPVIYGAGFLAPVARRWKTQLNENGKTWAQFEEMPELNYNASSGVMFPAPLMTRVHVTFLVSPPFDPPPIARRLDLTYNLYMEQGIAVDKVKGRGSNPLTQAMSVIQYGDYVSYYVAMAYQVDPTPTPALAELEERLSHSPS